jgi:hypothetical protein
MAPKDVSSRNMCSQRLSAVTPDNVQFFYHLHLKPFGGNNGSLSPIPPATVVATAESPIPAAAVAAVESPIPGAAAKKSPIPAAAVVADVDSPLPAAAVVGLLLLLLLL